MPGRMKNMPKHGGNRANDLWNARSFLGRQSNRLAFQRKEGGVHSLASSKGRRFDSRHGQAYFAVCSVWTKLRATLESRGALNYHLPITRGGGCYGRREENDPREKGGERREKAKSGGREIRKRRGERKK